jgi:hypothetical protein
MPGQINSINDLMRGTYQGTFALELLGAIPQGMGTPAMQGAGALARGDLLKADDQFVTTKTNYFNPIYGAAVFNWLNYESDVWKLLRKTTFQQLGDSFRVTEATATNFWGQLETATALGDTDIPTLREVTVTKPAIMYNHWNSTFHAQLQSTYQDAPKKNAEAYFREHFTEQHPSDINAWLMKDTDTLAASGGNFDNYIESIDRVCSDAAEEALAGIDAGDCDIHGFDRSAGEGEAYNDINAGVNRDLDAGLLDDMIGDCKKYSKKKNFIMITDEAQLSTLEALESVKHRQQGQDKWKIDVRNGVNTRKGAIAGFSVSSYHGAGIEVPIFTTKDCHAEAGGNGNIYLLDSDEIEIRIALPTVYLATDKTHFLPLDSMQFLYMFMTVAQLVPTKFACHGAIKYLN